MIMKLSSVRLPTAAPLALAAALLTIGSAHAAVLLSDGFESGQNFGSAPTYSGTGTIVNTEARTGSSALMMDNDPTKEAVLYTLPDVFQIGTYDVSFYVKHETGNPAANYSLLTYNFVSVADVYAFPVKKLGEAYIQAPALTTAYQQITFTATLLAGDAALGQSIQLLLDQSFGSGATARIFLDDLTITYTAPAGVPAPATLGMALAGATCVGVSTWRRRKRV
jgi:hypothetical protein